MVLVLCFQCTVLSKYCIYVTIIGVFLSLAALIAGSSILTVLALLISQKIRDIAILRAIGLSVRARERARGFKKSHLHPPSATTT